VKHLKSLGLFSSAELIPRPDKTKEGGVVVEFQLRELEPSSAGVNTDWSIVPGDQGRPTLVMHPLNLEEPCHLGTAISLV